MCHTVVAKEAHGFLRLDSNERSDEVIDDGCDEDNEQEDLGLQKQMNKFFSQHSSFKPMYSSSIVFVLRLVVSVLERGPCSYLGLPFHPCHRDAQEKDHCDGADDSDIVDFIRHDGIYTLGDSTRSG